jgi:1-acyl-sn-glycerol-3-phosphate acyltransferase
MRTIYFYFSLFFTLILKTPKLNKLKKEKGKIQQLEYYRQASLFTKSWAQNLLKIAGAEVSILGTKNIPQDEAILFVSNHQGNFDIPLCLSSLNKDIGFVSKTELLKVPFISTWMQEVGCIFMDRTDMRQSAKCILEGIETLKSGHSLVVFPEGTRSKSGTMSEFKHGAFKLATKPKVTIVPITINGSYKLMEGNHKNKVRPAKVSITIHSPIYTKNLSPQEIKELPDKVFNIIQSSL